MAAMFIIEVAVFKKLAQKIGPVPEEEAIEIFAPQGTDKPLDERM